MKIDKKTIAFFFIVITIIILIVYGFFSLFKNSSNNEVNQLKVASTINSEPVLINEKVFYPKIINENQFIALMDLGRFFYSFNNNNSVPNKILDHEILDPVDISYSPNGDKAVVISKYPEVNVKLYDLVNKNQKELSSNIKQVFFQDQNKIYYSYYDSEKETWELNLANADFSQRSSLIKLEKSGIPDFAVSPQDDKAIIYNEWASRDNIAEQSFVFDFEKNNLTKIDEKYQVTSALWSPEGTKIACTDPENNLFIINSDFSSETKTKVYTMPEKIIWSSDNDLLLAVPSNFSNFDGIFKDNIYIYQLNENKIEKIETGQTFLENVNPIKYENNKLYYLSNNNLFELQIAK